MKRVLSLVLVLVLVLGAIVPAFAEETATQAALDLETYGVIAGNGTDLGDAMPITRAQMAVLYARLQGKGTEAEAYTLPTTLTDVADAWYTPWTSYVAAQGWMVGSGNMFRPMDNVTAQEVRVLLLKALGYFTSWDNVTADSAASGIVITAADETLPLGSEVFAAVRTIIDMPMKDATDTLGTTLALTDYVAPVVEVPVTDLAVLSVTAPNARQVVIEFNKDVDAASVIAANVKVYVGTATAVTTWTSTVAGNTVTLGLTAGVAQDTAVKVVVAGVTAGEETLASTEMTTTMKDLVNPVILNVNAQTSKTFVIETSEPLVVAAGELTYHVLANIKIDGVALVGMITPDYDANTLTVELGTKLAVGTHTIDFTGAKDLVGFAAAPFAGSIEVIADTTTASVTGVTFVDINTIKIVFDEPVTAAGTITVDGNATTLGALSTDKMTQTVTLTTPLGLANLITSTLSYNGTVDMEGNTITTAKTFAFVADDDLIAPTATMSITAANKVQVVFSETVSAAGTLTVTNAAGDTVAAGALVIDATDTTNKTYVSTNAIATTAGTYTIALKDSADNGVRANKIITFSTALTTNDITAPTIEQVLLDTAYAAGPPVVNGKVDIYFSETMDATSATTLTNYMIDLDGGGANAAVQLSSITGGAAVLSADAKVVTLTVPGATFLAGTTTVAVLAVKDVAANLIATADFNSPDVVAAAAPALTESAFQMTALNQIKVTFSNPMVAIDPSNFVVQAGSGTAPATALPSLVGVAYTLDATNKIATITLSGNLTVDGMLTGDDEAAELVITAGNSKDIYGVASAQTAVDLVDKVVPTISTVRVLADTGANSKKIVLTFNEDVYADVTADLALDADLKIMVNAATPYQLPVGEYAAANTAGTITITLAPTVDIVGKTITVELLNNRFIGDDTNAAATWEAIDNAANVFAAMTVKNVAGTASFAFETVAPTVTAIAVATNNTITTVAKATETVTYTFTFSEAVTVSGVTASTANNIATAVTTDLDAAAAATDTVVFTVAADTGAVTLATMAFTITDVQGNATAYANLAAVVADSGAVTGTATADTTAATRVAIDTSTSVTGFDFNEDLYLSGVKLIDGQDVSAIITETSVGQVVSSAVYTLATNVITVTLDGAALNTEQVVLTVTNLTDIAGNAVPATSVTSDGANWTLD